MLRTIISTADENNTAVYLHFDAPSKENIKQNYRNINLNKLMQNVGSQQFDYGTFKAAYDTDPRIKTMTHNFSYKGIEPKTKQNIKITKSDLDKEKSKNDVTKMAKNATDLGDKL